MVDLLVDIVSDQRGVEQESEPLSREEEAECEESVGDHLGEDKLGLDGVMFGILGVPGERSELLMKEVGDALD